jgi:hypothetical protein
MPSEHVLIFTSTILELLVLLFVGYEVIVGEFRHRRSMINSTEGAQPTRRIGMRLGLFIALISGMIWSVVVITYYVAIRGTTPAFTAAGPLSAPPAGSSRMETWSKWELSVTPDKRLAMNVYVTNKGKAAASKFKHHGYMIVPSTGSPEHLLDGFFAMLHNELVISGGGTDAEYYPEQNLWFTIFGPEADDKTMEAINNGSSHPYILNLMSYSDNTIPNDKFIYTETCIYLVQNVVHYCESGHNKTYMAD